MWQTIGLYGSAVVVLLVGFYLLVRMLRTESRSLGGDREAKEWLEEMARREKRARDVGAAPPPLSRAEQLKRMRALAKKASRRRDRAMPDDD